MDLATIVTIILSGLAAFFAAITYFHTLRSDKNRIKDDIAAKQAELDSINSYLSGFHQNIDLPELRHFQTRKRILETELKRLMGIK